MRFVRRASLVFSLVLIVAIAVGYVARTSELAGDRDVNLTTASELGAADLSSIIKATSVTARAATNPVAAADALASAHRGLGVCVVNSFNSACSGAGPRPDGKSLDDALTERNVVEPRDNARTLVSVYDSLMTIEAVGPHLTALVRAPADVIDGRSEIRVKATTLLPADGRPGGFTVDQGLRQTSTQVEGAVDVFVVATGPEAVALPPEEYRFYLVIFTLAVILLFLAGLTIFVEQRSLHERASFDSLTKLPNRGEFERRAAEVLANADRAESGACLLLFDLNGFKQINDTHGHLAGDEMLKVVGSRLRKAVRDDDVVARWGGDEFVVMMPGIETEEMGSRRALQLSDQISGRTRLEGIDQSLRVKVSVGVAIWPHHGVALGDLVVAADQAMYEAKREGVACRVAVPAPPEPELIHTHA